MNVAGLGLFIPPRNGLKVAIWIACLAVMYPITASAETFGIKDSAGKFHPKVTISLGSKDIVVKKINPQERFRSITLTLNPKNTVLIRNVGLLNVEWINQEGKAGKLMPFSGPRYDPGSRKFEDTMGKSVELRILDSSTRNLFAGKTLPDLFEIKIDDQLLVSSESVLEKDRTVQMGAGRDVSINLDKTSMVFNENNLRKGEILNVDNRSGLNQVIGVDFPDRGLLYHQIIRKPEQTKVPKESWKKFTLGADSGVFIVLIPEPEASQLALLNGKDIVIKVFQGANIRETLKVPIKTSPDLRPGSESFVDRTDSLPTQPAGQTVLTPESREVRSAEHAEKSPGTGSHSSAPPVIQKSGGGGDITIWAVQIINFLLLVGLAAYAMFFMMPKIQVLQDRLAKNEMFIHSSREAIREEMEQIKGEITGQSGPPPASE